MCAQEIRYEHCTNRGLLAFDGHCIDVYMHLCKKDFLQAYRHVFDVQVFLNTVLTALAS